MEYLGKIKIYRSPQLNLLIRGRESKKLIDIQELYSCPLFKTEYDYFLNQLKEIIDFNWAYSEPDILFKKDLMFFNNVSIHDDAHYGDYRKNKTYFLNVMIRGSGILTVDGKELELSRGDVVLFDPSKDHSFKKLLKSNKTCIMMGFVIINPF